MSVAGVLTAYGLLVAVLAPVMLVRLGWAVRAPRLAIWAWQAATMTILASAVLAGLVLVVPTVPVSGSFAEMLHACAVALRARYATPGGTVAGATGVALASGVVLRVAGCLAAQVWRARRDRGRHAAVLTVIGRDRPDLGVIVLDEPRPAVYCLPGGQRRIVLTSAALAALAPDELDAVLAHERAHIRQRHHLVLAYATALERAFPRVPVFGTAAAQTRRLVELAADDAVRARGGALPLVEALVGLAGAGAPAGALAAAGSQVAARARRLLAPYRPLRATAAWAGSLATLAMLALPFILAIQPALTAIGMPMCPVPGYPGLMC